MDAVIAQVQDVFEGQVDFEGQRVTETISTVMLSFFSGLALIVGLIQQDIHLVMWIGLLGAALTMLVVVPPWPFYNQNPQPWIGSRSRLNLPHGGIVVQGMKVS